jgi:hypothetical protein
MSKTRDDLNDAELERSLRALVPAGGRIDRDRVMYLAGRRGSAPPSLGPRAWAMAAAAALGGILAGGAATWNLRPERVVERVVIVRENGITPPAIAATPTPTPDAPPAPLAASSETLWPGDPATMNESMRLRRQLALYGVEGLPEPPPLVTRSRGRGDRNPETAGAMLRREMDRILRTGDML